jgi:Cu-Zn family superoxide dismutase
MSHMKRTVCKIGWRPALIMLTGSGMLGCQQPDDEAVGSFGSPAPSQESPIAQAPTEEQTPSPATTQPSPRDGQRSFASAAAPDEATANAAARAEIRSIDDDISIGTVEFRSMADGRLEISAQLNGLEPGLHGIHIHENGDCSGENASAAGDHFSPDGDPHGAPADSADAHHAGDLGNLTVNQSGSAEMRIIDEELALAGELGIVDRAVIIHDGEDDLTTQPSGDSGDPIACGVIRSTAENDTGSTYGPP